MKRIAMLVVVLSLGMFAAGVFAEDAAKEEAAKPAETPKIQIAILLDTSNSMDGLIDQTKNQLWEIVNDFLKVKQLGVSPELEVALYQYGNDGLDPKTDYIQQMTPFTTDLDLVSEKLFGLKTNGGLEYCGAVINRAVQELKWSDRRDDLRLIFIAGNEPFDQEPGKNARVQNRAQVQQVQKKFSSSKTAAASQQEQAQATGAASYVDACKGAANKHIIVNTIHCGGEEEGRRTHWEDGALLTDGKYLVIDQNQAVVSIPAPQDKRLAELNSELNTTYIPFGQHGKAGAANQVAQDANNTMNFSARVLSKSGKFYRNDSWDLVDAAAEDNFDLSKIETKDLPEAMQKMTSEEKKTYIAKHAEKRQAIQKEIGELSKARAAFIAEERSKMTEDDESFGAVSLGIMREQAEKAKFKYEE